MVLFLSRCVEIQKILVSYRLEPTSSGVEDTDDEDGDAGNVDVNSCHLNNR